MVDRKLTLKCKLKCYVKPMKDPLGLSPSKGNQGTTRGKEKNISTSVGIEPTTSGLDLPLVNSLFHQKVFLAGLSRLCARYYMDITKYN